MDWIANLLNIEHPEDWYGITKQRFCQYHGGRSIWRYAGSLQNLLVEYYPNFTWDNLDHSYQSQSTQKLVYKAICFNTIFLLTHDQSDHSSHHGSQA